MPVGKVEKIEGQFATVSIERQDMCGECHACEVVGEVKKCTIKCKDLCKSQAGELVEVELEKSTFLKATALMYGVPLVGLIMGLGIGVMLPISIGTQVKEMVSVILAIAGMGVGLLWLRKKEHLKKYDNLLPKIVKIINK